MFWSRSIGPAQASSKPRLWARAPAWPRGDLEPFASRGEGFPLRKRSRFCSASDPRGSRRIVFGHVDLLASAWPWACRPPLPGYKPLAASGAFILPLPHVAAARSPLPPGKLRHGGGRQHAHRQGRGHFPLQHRPRQHPRRASLGGGVRGCCPLPRLQRGAGGQDRRCCRGPCLGMPGPLTSRHAQQLAQLQPVLQLPPKPFSSSALKVLVSCVGLLVGLG